MRQRICPRECKYDSDGWGPGWSYRNWYIRRHVSFHKHILSQMEQRFAMPQNCDTFSTISDKKEKHAESC